MARDSEEQSSSSVLQGVWQPLEAGRDKELSLALRTSRRHLAQLTPSPRDCETINRGCFNTDVSNIIMECFLFVFAHDIISAFFTMNRVWLQPSHHTPFSPQP